jgi:hypothetical protein
MKETSPAIARNDKELSFAVGQVIKSCSCQQQRSAVFVERNPITLTSEQGNGITYVVAAFDTPGRNTRLSTAIISDASNGLTKQSVCEEFRKLRTGE